MLLFYTRKNARKRWGLALYTKPAVAHTNFFALGMSESKDATGMWAADVQRASLTYERWGHIDVGSGVVYSKAPSSNGSH